MATSPIDERAAFLAGGERQKAAVGRWTKALAIAVLAALGLRSLVYEPYNIPSESMQPGLLAGDYLFVAKWPYGYSRFSLPLGLDLFDGRIGGVLPARGDVVVFKTPRDNRADFIKRVIGLPGDRIRMVGGLVEINGRTAMQAPAGETEVPAGPGGCSLGQPAQRSLAHDGRCRFPAFAETLPGNRRVTVIDQVSGGARDDTATVTVPAGHLFVLGDNRDDSADSRFSTAEGGVGMVPVANIVGRADWIFFSLDPDAPWLHRFRMARIGAVR